MQPALLQALLNSIPLPVLAIDNAGQILELNHAAQQLLPAKTKKPVGKQLADLLPALGEVVSALNGSDQGFKRSVELGAEQLKEVTLTPLAGYGWSVIFQDVPASASDSAPSPALAPMEIDNAKVDLIAEVAHDLKQPIASILSFSDVLQASGELNPQQVKFLGRIRGAAKRMSEQVHQLLDMAWIESGMKLTLVEVDLVNLAQDIVEELEARAALRSITLELQASANVPTITADSSRLSQVITNLVTNAIKYSPDNTKVHIQVATQDNNIVFTVKDEGIGIAPEELPQLFRRFHRVHDKQTRNIEGTGLGLYISRSIVHQHGGRIEVASTPGEGSAFTVYLPVKVAAANLTS